MRKDEDFKPVMDKDGNPIKNENGDTIYSNLDKVCEGLPQWGDLICFKCKEIIRHDPDNPFVNFFRYDVGNEPWYKFFHDDCTNPDKTQDDIEVKECGCDLTKKQKDDDVE